MFQSTRSPSPNIAFPEFTNRTIETPNFTRRVEAVGLEPSPTYGVTVESENLGQWLEGDATDDTLERTEIDGMAQWPLRPASIGSPRDAPRLNFKLNLPWFNLIDFLYNRG